MSHLADNSIQALLQRPQSVVMGIINVTPDSFSDGGLAFEAKSAVAQGLQMVADGADILDVGGESTRPGAEIVSLQQELDRVIPVIEQLLVETETPISIDTYKPEVMQAAVAAGASMINDVKALQTGSALTVAAKSKVPVCLMHMSGNPDTMQNSPVYDDVVTEVVEFLRLRVDSCLELGIARKDIIIDPGIGFGKTLEHNLQLLAAIPELKKLSSSVLIGVSRKSMIDHLLGRSVDQRLPASLGLAVQSVLNGAKIVRVHDVRATSDAIRSVEAVLSH